MAGERAREVAQQVQQKADELMGRITDKEQQVSRLRSEVGEERREMTRETIEAASPSDTPGADTGRIVESQQEISSHKGRIRQLETEIVELKNEANRLNDENRILTNLAEAAEAAEGQANDAVERALSEL